MISNQTSQDEQNSGAADPINIEIIGDLIFYIIK